MNTRSSQPSPDDHDYVVECFWPGVTTADVDELDRRARAIARGSRRRGIPVRYLGSLLVPDDEIVVFEFQACSPEVVAEASVMAGIPFQRIALALRTTQ